MTKPKKYKQPTFDDLLEKAVTEYEAYENGITKPTERLYASLEAAYRLEVLGESKPEEYESFIEKEFAKRKLGKVTKATHNSPFMRAIRLILGNDESRSPDRTRYSLTLAAVKAEIGDQGVKANVADFIKEHPRRIDGLVEKARTEKAKEAVAVRDKIGGDEKGKAIVLAGTPKGEIADYAKPPIEEGFRLVLCNLNAEGTLVVYDKEVASGVDALFRKVYSLQQKSRPNRDILLSLVQASIIFPRKLLTKEGNIKNDNHRHEMVLINHAGRCYAELSKAYGSKAYPIIKVVNFSAISGLTDDHPICVDNEGVTILREAAKSQKFWEHGDVTVAKNEFVLNPVHKMKVMFAQKTESFFDDISSHPPTLRSYELNDRQVSALVLGEKSTLGAKKIILDKDRPKKKATKKGYILVGKKEYELTFTSKSIEVESEDFGSFSIDCKPISSMKSSPVKITVSSAIIKRGFKALLKVYKEPFELGCVDAGHLYVAGKDKNSETRIYLAAAKQPQKLKKQKMSSKT